jgi:hypothetical protein
MKDLKDYVSLNEKMSSINDYLIGEAKQKQKKVVHKNTKQIADLTFHSKYKTKDINLKKKLEKVTQNLKKKFKVKVKESICESAIDEWNKNKDAFMEEQKESILDNISNYMQNNLDDWKTSWDEPEDMNRDLDTAVDWFWNECDDYIDDFLCDIDDPEDEIDSKEIWNYVSEKWSDEIDELIEKLCEETREYANEKYFDGGESWTGYYGDNDDDDEDDDDDNR